MFGYVRPVKEKLSEAEWARYEAVYCGVCHTMGKRHGLTARALLNYDFTFLAMLLLPGQGNGEPTACRCPANPARKKPCACLGSVGMDRAADESVILSYWKLRDSVQDEGFWKGMGARVVSLFLRRGYRRAARACPEFDETVRESLEELHALEREGSQSLDRTADAFARLLCSAAPDTGEARRDRIYRELLYHLGRWIYLLDAWDDLDADISKGRYNPIHARFGGKEREEEEYVRTTLLHSRNLMLSACELLELGEWESIVKNILYLGLPVVEELVFRGEWEGDHPFRIGVSRKKDGGRKNG